jgi:hypothetical protein
MRLQVIASLLSSAVMIGFKANLCNSILRSAVLRKHAEVCVLISGLD